MSEYTLYIAALKLSIEKWIHLFNNPYGDEKESPVWEEIKNLQNTCALCDLFLGFDEGYPPAVTCGKCVLNTYENNCFYTWSPCRKWKLFPEIRKQCAARVVGICRREYEKITGDKKTFRKGDR